MYPWSHWQEKTKERFIYGLWASHMVLMFIIGWLTRGLL